MKNTRNTSLRTLLFLFSLTTLILSSCQKSPINGDLDGQWQVMDISPEPAITEPDYDTRMYYCFSLHVCQLTIPGLVWISGNIQYDYPYLSIHFPKQLTSQEVAILHQYGINSNPVEFTIDKLDGKSLVLRDGDTVVTLRKF